MHNPEEILRPFVTSGMTVLDIGSAMGFFTLPLAKIVGPSGKVVSVDVQEKMLQSLQRRALKARVLDRIITRVCKPTSLCLDGLDGTIDFALAFAVVHEVHDVSKLFADLFPSLKYGAKCLIAEPKGHVSAHDFELTLSIGEQAGLRVAGKPKITLCHAALLNKD
ncbi:MAG: methyltransferase domain-containing protein [Candidatus Tectomicrobia bacterium]|uniref:Methyltransferase domain-containing protein n=1 Tax=Tectimicrobiota bacterium TaxID=2528274 RepID=A0A933GNF2_UNCTE|nr:methyltransferase domain-containing protein [Candidatus Tectomicrobia bacterium]